jgi:hypothetical protein
MKLVSLILAHASVDDVNAPVSPRDGRTPLHLASSIGNLAMAQLLIWVNFYFNPLDQLLDRGLPTSRPQCVYLSHVENYGEKN